MPPPQHLLASRIRGYVCRPCLLKLQKPSKRIPGLCRSIANESQRPKSKPKPAGTEKRDGLGKAEHPSLFEDESSIRYFEEAPDGTRREVLRDNDEETLKETLSSFRNLENQSGISSQTLMEALESTTNILDPPGSLDHTAEIPFDLGALEALQLQNKQLRLQIQKLESKSALKDTSPTELLALFKPITTNGNTSLQSSTSPIEDANPSREQREMTISSEVVPTSGVDGKKAVPGKGDSTRTQQSSIHIPVEKFPQEYRMKIQTMKETLDQALFPTRHRKPGKFSTRLYSPFSKLWKEYLLCRPGLLSLPNEIPFIFWATLWRVFESNKVKNLDRMVHLKTIGDDMLKAGVRMEPSQRILYIESTFIHGDQVEAIRDWELTGRTRWNDTDLAKEYQELGVRMFCITKQIDRALQSAETILQNSQNVADHRILIPIITACLSMEDGPDVEKAWGLFKRMRLGLGDTIKMEDYDRVTSLFLEANQPDLALRMFTDMMLTGDKSTVVQGHTHTDQISAPETHQLTPGIRESRLNWEDSRSIAKLPPKFNNKHFFGSWTKKLIGAGELASVKKVFDLMQDRGICPSSIHMNGLIGAWLRDGTEKSRVMAEELAWKMIKARVDFVKERDHLREKRSLIRAVYTSGKPDNKSLLLIPLATMETFTILIQQYRRRQKYELFGPLFDALNQTRIPVDTVFMNELLWIDTKGHHKGWVWKTYQSLMETRAASPDFITYAILWQNMKKQEDPVIGKKPNADPSNFTTCQKLFADMIKRTATLRKKKELPRELYDLIVLCFNYSQDITATAVALRALQQHFNVFPNIQTARSMILQLARLGLVVPAGGDRRLLGYPTAEKRIAEVTKVLEILKKQRIKDLKDQGTVYEDLNEREKEEEALTLLLDLLRYTYDSRKGTFQASSFTAATRAADEMGVPDCVPWGTSEKEHISV